MSASHVPSAVTLPGIAVAAVAASLIALGLAAPAAADPAPEPDPPPPGPAGLIPSLATIGSALAQTGSQPAGPFGLPDLSAHAEGLLLGQMPAPAAPGDPGPVGIPSLSAFNPDYLVPLNTAPAAPGEGTPAAGIGPDADSTGTGRIAFLRRLYEMYQGGDLTGALLGQEEPGELGDRVPDADQPTRPAESS